jgi:uncharacterized membrane protein YidH (DUF202 family)
VPSGRETQAAERTGLARERSALSFLFIGALLATHTHVWLGVSAGLLVGALGVRARSPRDLAIATGLAALTAVVIVIA